MYHSHQKSQNLLFDTDFNFAELAGKDTCYIHPISEIVSQPQPQPYDDFSIVEKVRGLMDGSNTFDENTVKSHQLFHLLAELQDHNTACYWTWELLASISPDKQFDAVNLLNDDLVNALYIAVRNSNVELAKLLLAHGINVDGNAYAFVTRNTPLVLAVSAGNLELCELLLQHKANVFAQDNNGNTLAMLATKMNHEHLMEYFKAEYPHILAWLAAFNPASHESRPIDLAVLRGDSNAVRIWVEVLGKKSCEEKNRHGYSVIDLARWRFYTNPCEQTLAVLNCFASISTKTKPLYFSKPHPQKQSVNLHHTLNPVKFKP